MYSSSRYTPKTRRLYKSSGFSNVQPYVYPDGRDSNRAAKSGDSYVVRPYRKRYTGLPRTVSTVYPRPEQKFFDLSTVPVPMALSGSVSAGIFAPTQGSSASQYLGNTVNLKSVYVRYTVRCGPTPVPAGWRVMVIYDRQSNGTGVNVVDILSNPSITAYMNLNNRDRFVVLINQTGTCNPSGQNEVYLEAYKPINMQSTLVSGTAIPTSGALLFLAISDQGTVANQPLFDGYFRTKFVDC